MDDARVRELAGRAAFLRDELARHAAGAGTEAKARIGETLNRNDSSDVADTDLFDNSHRDITEHKNEK
jgi:hypothetical protein